MDLVFIRIEIFIVIFYALFITLPWSVFYSVYLNRIGSRGMASLKQLAKKSMIVFLPALIGVMLYRNMNAFIIFAGVGLEKAESMFQLASGYYHGGTILKQDFVKAKYWYERSAESGHAMAQFELASMYHYGEGTPRDDQESLRLARLSAAQGNCYAMVLAGELLAASPRAEDRGKAFDFFRQAHSLLEQRVLERDAAACIALGMMYRSGNGVKQDAVEGLKWMILGDRIGLSPLHHLALEQFKKQATPSELAEANLRANRLYARLGSSV